MLPFKVQIHTANKWVPFVIPLEEIPMFFNALGHLPKHHTFNKQDHWNRFLVRRNKLMFAMQFILGARPGEIRQLKFTDIFKDTLGRYLIFLRGENNKVRKDRYAKVPPILAKMLNRFLNEVDYKKFWGNSIWLFPSFRDRNNPISSYRYNEVFQLAIKKAGLWRPHPRKVGRGLYTAHSLRHSRATHLLDASNHDLWFVSNILGHQRTDVTACYLHSCPSIDEYERRIMNIGQNIIKGV